MVTMTDRDSYTDGYHAGFIQALANYREGGPFWQATDDQIDEMAMAELAAATSPSAVADGDVNLQ